jgi:hypothetical protein
MLLFSSLAAFSWSKPVFAAGSHGGGGGGHGGGSHLGGGGHYAGGRGGYGGRGAYGGGYRGGYGGHGGYGGRGGYGYHGGYGGWGWGGVGLGLGLYYATLPFYYSTFWGADGLPYYYADDNYYQWDGNASEYETVSPPPDVQRQAANQAPNLMAYPKNGQSVAQQTTDKKECLTWAAAQSGFDPAQGAVAQDPASGSSNKRSDYMRAEAACFEGRGYSVK